MNPLRAWRLYRATRHLLGIYQEATMSKSIFKSKTVWINLLSAAIEVAGLLPIPAGTAVVVVNVINIALRLITSQPVHLVHAEE